MLLKLRPSLMGSNGGSDVYKRVHNVFIPVNWCQRSWILSQRDVRLGLDLRSSGLLDYLHWNGQQNYPT